MSDNDKTKKQLLREVQALRQRVAELQKFEDERGRAAEALRRQNEYLTALHETALGLVGRLDITDLLQAIITRAGALVGTANGYIYLLDLGGAEMEARIGAGVFGDDVGSRTKFGEGLIGQVWQTAQPLIVDDYCAWPGRVPDARYDVLHAVVGVPLKSGLQVVGVIGLAYLEEARAFGNDEIQLLGQFAELASIALDNAQLFHETQATLAENEALYHVSRAISQAASVQDILDTVVTYIMPRQADRASLIAVLYNGQSEPVQVQVVGFRDLHAEYQRVGIHIPAGALPILDKLGVEPQVIQDVTSDPGVDPVTRATLLKFDIVATCLTPLRKEGKLIGILTTSARQPTTFVQAETRLLRNAAEQVAIALENLRLLEQVEANLALLQNRTLQLSTAAEVSRAASSILDLNELLPRVVELIRDRFALYYVGVFLVDETMQYAALRAGTGQAGQKMLEAGHRLEVGGASMIGWCVANAQARIALDVGKDAVRFGNPLLPATRSELALPLVSRGNAIGAMTVQSTQEAAFSDEDIATLQTMADQVANSIENARLFQETRQRITELSILNEISQAFSSALDLDQLLELIYRQISRVFDTTNFFIVTYEEGSDEWMMAFQIEHGKWQPPERRKMGIGLSSYIIRNRKPLILHNLQENNAFFEQQGLTHLGQQAKSWMGVPLMASGNVVGIMAIQNYVQENLYGDQDFALFSTIAANAATAVQNARLFEERERRITELSIFNEISQAFSSALELDMLLETAHRQISRLFDTTNFFIATYQEGSAEWTSVFQVERGERQPRARHPLGVGFTSYIIRNRQPLLIRNTQEHEAFIERQGINRLGEQAKSWMGVPLIVAGQIAGVMGIQNYEQDNLYGEQDLAIFTTVGAQVAIALQNARLFEETRQRLAELSILNKIGQAFSSAVELNELMQVVYQQVGQIFDATNFYIATYEEGSDEWVWLFHIEHHERQPITRHKLGTGFTSQIIQSRQPVVSNSADELQRLLEEYKIVPVGERPKSWMGVPLLAGGKIVGVMAIQSYEQENLYAPQDVSLFSTIAAQAAVAIQNARLFEETRQRVAELSVLNDIGQAFSTALRLEELPEIIYKQVGRLLDTSNFYIAFYDEESDEWETVFDVIHKQRQPSIRMRGKVGLTGYVIRTRQPLLLRDYHESVAFHKKEGIELVGEESQSWMGVPLIAGNRTLGVMAIESYDQENLYSEQDVRLFFTIALQAAIAVQNARLFEETRKRVEQTQLLLRVSEAAASTIDSTEVMRRVAREAARALGADMAGAYLPDETGKQLKAVAGYHVPPELLEQFLAYHPPLAGNRFTEEAYKNKQTVFSSDIPNDPRLDADIRQLLPAQSVLLTPMFAKETVVGGLWLVWWKQVRRFTEDEKYLVQGLVRQAAVAIENARLFDDAHARAEEMSSLNVLSRSLTAHFGVDEILEGVYQGSVRLFPNRSANFYAVLYDQERNETIFALNVVAGKVDKTHRISQAGHGMTDYVLRQRETVLVREHIAEWLADKGIEVSRRPDAPVALPASWVGAPMIAGDRLLGMLALSDYGRPGAYNEHDRDLLTAIASQTAIALQNARLFEEQQQARALLATRVQELDCLNDIGRKINEVPPVPEFLEWAAQRIPQAMQYADLCRVAIEFEGALYGAPEAVDLPRQMVAGLYSGAEMVGQICISYTQLHDFLNEESALLGDIVRRVSGYIENRRLIEQTQARARREQILREITTRVRGSTNPDTIVRTAVRELGAALGRATFVRLGSADQLLQSQAQPDGTSATASLAGDGDGSSASTPSS